MLGGYTPEELQAIRKQRRLDKIAYAEANLRTEYTDDKFWTDIARQMGVRLPVWYEAASPKIVRKVLKAIDKDTSWLYDSWGVKSINRIIEMNPTYNARAIVGLILEEKYYEII